MFACTYKDPATDRTVALVGSSHAEHRLTALDEIGQSRGVRIVTHLKMGCPRTLSDEPVRGDRYPDCRDWSREVLDRLRVGPRTGCSPPLPARDRTGRATTPPATTWRCGSGSPTTGCRSWAFATRRGCTTTGCRTARSTASPRAGTRRRAACRRTRFCPRRT
ncbi:SGNH hydrolase domain-containing protein [Rhodococcus ruber]|uniref:SGNH hydrolase domain-containing protein n=1 Tax=Rhodococcus ruber TaxID=1830 RepID=UPI00315CD27F